MSDLTNPLPAIVFDFGGVLIDWDPRHLYRQLFEGDADAMERFLVEIGFVEWNLQQDGGRPFAVAIAELTERFPHHADLIRAFDVRWVETVDGPIQPTVEILEELKEAGYPLYALSNWSAETFRRIRHQHAFLEWFDTIVLSGDVGYIKPDPRIYQALLTKIGRKADECLFIDDLEANIVAARQLGLRTILYESPNQLADELSRLGLLKRKGDPQAKPSTTAHGQA
jgi:2-haloacid dehalogenase